MVVEFARNVCGLKGAHTTEVDPKTKYPVIDILEEQKKFLKEKLYGGTMRLGDWVCEIKKGTIAWRAYALYPDKNRIINYPDAKPDMFNNLLRLELDTLPGYQPDTSGNHPGNSSGRNPGDNNQRKSALDPYLSVVERHRHRYEVNPKFYEILQNKGLIFSGIHSLNNTQSNSLGSLFLVEIIELPEKIHPFFLGTQFHPEFKSRFLHPHPLFFEFIKKSLRLSKKK
jgi:CTP synthase